MALSTDWFSCAVNNAYSFVPVYCSSKCYCLTGSKKLASMPASGAASAPAASTAAAPAAGNSLFLWFRFRPHSYNSLCMAYNEANCYRHCSIVGRSVCLLVVTMSPAKAAESIKMPFGIQTCGCPENYVLDCHAGRGTFGRHSKVFSAENILSI